MDNERRNKLMATLKDFNKEHKSEVFTMGSEVKEIESIPSGIKQMDDFIGGGFKQGGHTIVYGQFSVGKTAWVLQTVANAQKLGKLVCYVNTEKPIEPERFRFFGVKLEELVYIEAPENAEQALEAMRRLCKEKVIDLFIIDSTNGLCPKSVQEEKEGKERGLEKKNVASLPLTLSNFYNVVNSYVFKSKAAVIWIGQQRTKGIGSYFVHDGLTGGNAQSFYAYQIIQLKRGQGSNAPVAKFKEYYLEPDSDKLRYSTVSEPIGFSVIMKLDKTNSCNSAKEKSELETAYYYKSGFQAPTKEVKEEIRITGTDEEKAKIKAILQEKGILPLDTIVESNLAEQTSAQLNENAKNEESIVEVEKETKIEKKRGRKPKATIDKV